MSRFLYWTPRSLSIALVIFISLFALDVFSEGYTGWDLIVAFIMHLLPTSIAIIFVIIAWKWELIGGILFVILGIAYLFIGNFEIIAILAFTLPFEIIGGLYLAHYFSFVKTKTILENKKQRGGVEPQSNLKE